MGKSNLKKHISDNVVFYLAATACLYIFLPPFLRNEAVKNLLILILNSALIGLSILVITGSKLRPVHFLLIEFMVVPWLLNQNELFDVVILAAYFVLFAVTSYKLTNQLFLVDEVDKQVIVGSILGYLMIGLGYTFLCAILLSFVPDSFNTPDSFESAYNFVYFTFVTMSTLGYGDITPNTPQAKSLSILIAVTGQFYMLIVVAAIVGKFVSK